MIPLVLYRALCNHIGEGQKNLKELRRIVTDFRINKKLAVIVIKELELMKMAERITNKEIRFEHADENELQQTLVNLKKADYDDTLRKHYVEIGSLLKWI